MLESVEMPAATSKSHIDTPVKPVVALTTSELPSGLVNTVVGVNEPGRLAVE